MTGFSGGPRTEEGKEVVRWNAADATRHPRSGDTPSGVADTKTAVADAEPASKNGLSKPKGNGSGPVAGVAGALGSNEQEGSCRHGYPEGVGCYLCDPNYPYRLKEMAKA